MVVIKTGSQLRCCSVVAKKGRIHSVISRQRHVSSHCNLDNRQSQLSPAEVALQMLSAFGGRRSHPTIFM